MWVLCCSNHLQPSPPTSRNLVYLVPLLSLGTFRGVRSDMPVAYLWVHCGQGRELVEVRCKEAECLDIGRNVGGNGPGQAKPIVGGRA